MDYRFFETPGAAGLELAREIYAGLVKAGQTGQNYVLGCPGGRTPMVVYEALAGLLKANSVDCSKLYIMMMDEYVLQVDSHFQMAEPNQHYSCVRFAKVEIQHRINQALPEAFGIPDDKVLVPNITQLEVYEQTLTQLGRIDLFILACGAGDGHVAFNPPGSVLESRTRLIQLAEQTRRDNLRTFPQFTGLAEVPTHGVSIGLGTIAQYSHRAVMLLLGEDKRTAYKRICSTNTYNSDWPGTIIHECRSPSVYTSIAGVTE